MLGSGLGSTETEIKSKFQEYQMPSRPSPRPLSWLEKSSQLYRAEKKYQLHLERVVEGFRRMDPPMIPQLAVPVTVPHTAYDNNVKNLDPILRRIGCLVLVAFYFLLRVGEYTKPRFIV